nr:phenylalanine racemase [Ornithinibacillus bavariensis]
MAKSYEKERDFAFFAVNFGYSKRDYNELTELEKRFIYKAYETRLISEMTHLRNAVLNAVNNALRKKNKRFIELYKKKQEKADKEYNENAIKVILEIEERKGKSWVDRVYQATGVKKPQEKVGE